MLPLYLGQPKPLQTTTKLYISVLDKDAVLPKFPAAFTTKDVSENSALGAIQKITAIGSNLGYEIVGGNRDNCFTISNNGQISLSKKLDYEKNQQYHLIIRATETNYPPRYSETVYTVNVQDENDNPPVFPVEDMTKHKQIYIDQYSPEKTVILKVKDALFKSFLKYIFQQKSSNIDTSAMMSAPEHDIFWSGVWSNIKKEYLIEWKNNSFLITLNWLHFG